MRVFSPKMHGLSAALFLRQLQHTPYIYVRCKPFCKLCKCEQKKRQLKLPLLVCFRLFPDLGLVLCQFLLVGHDEVARLDLGPDGLVGLLVVLRGVVDLQNLLLL